MLIASTVKEISFKSLGKAFKEKYKVQTNIEFRSWDALNFSARSSSHYTKNEEILM